MSPSLSLPPLTGALRSHVEYSLANEPKKFKLVFLGDSNGTCFVTCLVGKTSIITRFAYDVFEEEFQSTIGIDFLSKTVFLDDRAVKLQLWDTAGQERFKSLIPSYLRDCDAAIIVYDISNRFSFEHVDNWMKEVIGERGTKVKLFIVGSKQDAEPLRLVKVQLTTRQVSFQEGEKKADFYSASFLEVSALTNYNVSILFKKIASELPILTQDSNTESHHSNLKNITNSY